MELSRDEQRAYRIGYRLAWPTARRKPVLTGAVARDCRRWIARVCAEHGWTLETLDLAPTHVVMSVRVWPRDAAVDVLKACKRVTSHELRARHKSLLKLPSLWTRTYVAVTEGQVAPAVIERYLAQLRV